MKTFDYGQPYIHCCGGSPPIAFFEAAVNAMLRQGVAAKAAGGVAAMDVVNGTATIPSGWVEDPLTQYYLSPNVVLL